MSSKKSEKLEMPVELAEEAYKNVKPIVAKYLSDAKTDKHNWQLDLKGLCTSCYVQGLSDAQQIKKDQCN